MFGDFLRSLKKFELIHLGTIGDSFWKTEFILSKYLQRCQKNQFLKQN